MDGFKWIFNTMGVISSLHLTVNKPENGHIPPPTLLFSFSCCLAVIAKSSTTARRKAMCVCVCVCVCVREVGWHVNYNGGVWLALSVQGQGAITERLRSFSMQDLSQIDGNDHPNQLYPGYANPGRRAKSPDEDDDGRLNIASFLTKSTRI